ncbi:MAG: hypothetical protein M3Z83_11100 [Actinomycetota bacterium]|nr:hypothetical protein [Actinomycetota bacterium]
MRYEQTFPTARPTEPDDVAAEAWPGRLFTHGRLNDPMTGGPLYCRIRAVEPGRVEYEAIYHRDDGAERIGAPWRLPVAHFIESTFGHWYEGTTPPPAVARARGGEPVPMGPRKLGGRPAGS